MGKGYDLLKNLRDFTRLAFSYKVEQEELPKMRKWVASILEICREFHNEEQKKIIEQQKLEQLRTQASQSNQPPDPDPVIVPYKVVPKTHHIQHYPDEIEFFGPTALFKVGS